MGKRKEQVEIPVADEMRTERSGVGMTLGVATFLVGVALLLVTFKFAYNIFSVPPNDVIVTAKDQAVDLGRSANKLMGILLQVLALMLMGLMGSLIANRGISLFTSSRTRRHRE